MYSDIGTTKTPFTWKCGQLGSRETGHTLVSCVLQCLTRRHRCTVDWVPPDALVLWAEGHVRAPCNERLHGRDGVGRFSSFHCNRYYFFPPLPIFWVIKWKDDAHRRLDPYTNILFPSSVYRKAEESRLFVPEASLVDRLWNIMKCLVFVVESL